MFFKKKNKGQINLKPSDPGKELKTIKWFIFINLIVYIVWVIIRLLQIAKVFG